MLAMSPIAATPIAAMYMAQATQPAPALVSSDCAISYAIDTATLVSNDYAISYAIESAELVSSDYTVAYAIDAMTLVSADLSMYYAIYNGTAMSFTPSPSRTLTVSPTSKALTGGPWWNLANPAKPRGTKDPQAVLDVTLDWGPWLADIGGPPIAKFTATIFGVTQVGAFAEGALTTMVFSGGAAAEATITFEIETATQPPLRDERTVYIDLVNL